MLYIIHIIINLINYSSKSLLCQQDDNRNSYNSKDYESPRITKFLNVIECLNNKFLNSE